MRLLCTLPHLGKSVSYFIYRLTTLHIFYRGANLMKSERTSLGFRFMSNSIDLKNDVPNARVSNFFAIVVETFKCLRMKPTLSGLCDDHV